MSNSNDTPSTYDEWPMSDRSPTDESQIGTLHNITAGQKGSFCLDFSASHGAMEYYDEAFLNTTSYETLHGNFQSHAHTQPTFDENHQLPAWTPSTVTYGLTAPASLANPNQVVQPGLHVAPSLTSGISGVNTPSSLHGPRHTCQHLRCTKSFAHKGDLTRHITTAHHRPASFLCHFRRCPRGIPGNGFARKDKLVGHLVSKKHGLTNQDAIYEATWHNPSS